MTQHEADLIHWIGIRNSAQSWVAWRLAQGQVDALFRAMGYRQAEFAHLADRELIFPAVKEAFENGAGSGS